MNWRIGEFFDVTNRLLDEQSYHFEWKLLWFCEFLQLYKTVILFSAWDKSRDPAANWNKLKHMYTTKDPLCNISGGWELYLTSHRVRKADKASIHYLQSITYYIYHGILLHFWVLQQFEEADEIALSKSFQNSFPTKIFYCSLASSHCDALCLIKLAFIAWILVHFLLK